MPETPETPAAVMRRAAAQLRDVAPAVTGPLAGLADPVADWLEYEARLTDGFVAMGGTDHFDSLFTERPLAVALAVLGETAPASAATPRTAQ